MRKILIFICILLTNPLIHAAPEPARMLRVLAALEGPLPGRSGEVTHYHMMPAVWRTYTHAPLSQASDPVLADLVARTHLRYLAAVLVRRHQAVTPLSLALLWNAGVTGSLSPNPAQWSYAKRAASLYSVLPTHERFWRPRLAP